MNIIKVVKLYIYLIFILSLSNLINACASQAETVRPDAELQTAIAKRDCNRLYRVMSDEVQRHFLTEESFCYYYTLNRAQFERWAAGLNDRFVSGDYERYAYLADEPEGRLRLRWGERGWAFDTSPEGVSLQSNAVLKERFVNYLWRKSSEFIFMLKYFLESTQPVQARQIFEEVMDGLAAGPESARITFEGPFARIGLRNAELLFIYRKRSATQGAWELYRCHLSR